MTSQVSPEELDAILELVQPKLREISAVAERDFRQPKRLPASELDELASRARKAVPAIETELASWLRSAHEVGVASVSEANAADLVKALVDPFIVIAFECAGRACVALWEPQACVAVVETALGAGAVTDPKPRALSTVEVDILRTIVGRITTALCGTFSLEMKNLRVVQDLDTLNQLEIVQPGADPQRIGVHLSIDGAAGSSNLRVYLAGIQTRTKPDAAAKDKPRTALPQHLNSVSVELGAELGSADIPLSELLGIEVGDVIPLAVDVGTPLNVYVEGKACATAKWGENKGALAIRIQTISTSALAR